MTQPTKIKITIRPCKICKTDTDQEKQGVGKETHYICLECLMNPDSEFDHSNRKQGRLFDE